MLVDDGAVAVSGSSVQDFRLDVAVADLYADLRVTPLLRRLLGHTRGLLGTVAGSISLIDPGRGQYDKMAEVGIPCRLGQSFPLDEGATGQAFSRRRPVVIDDYSGLHGGHLPLAHPASHGAVAAVPLWWRDEVIAVNVAFAGRSRSFDADELDAFELLTQSVAPAVVKGGWRSHPRAEPAPPVAVAADQQVESPLTDRQHQVLMLLAEGMSDRAVAVRLGISPKTVEKHVGAALAKTGAASRTAAVVQALDRGWLRPAQPLPDAT